MALSLDARLLCAASHAYKVFADGRIRPTDEPAPKTRSTLAGYGDTAVGVVAGPESRDAALLGDTADGVVPDRAWAAGWNCIDDGCGARACHSAIA